MAAKTKAACPTPLSLQERHAPSCQNAISSSGLTTHSCSYMAKARLPATCFGLPYPIRFAACRNTLLSDGEASTFFVSHAFSRGGVVEGPGTSSVDGCCSVGGGAEESRRALRRSAAVELLAPRASVERGSIEEVVKDVRAGTQ